MQKFLPLLDLASLATNLMLNFDSKEGQYGFGFGSEDPMSDFLGFSGDFLASSGLFGSAGVSVVSRDLTVLSASCIFLNRVGLIVSPRLNS